MGHSPVEALIKIMQIFKESVSALNYTPSSHQLERWAMIVLEGMSGPARLYHSHDHVIELSDGLDPLASISALFHDIIYYQIDGGVVPFIHTFIYPYFNSVNGILFTKDHNQEDFVYDVTLEVFGYTKGQQLLVVNGQNEFLSALLALRVMSDALSRQELVMICVCIEATIPFRATSAAIADLEKRLTGINLKHCLGMSQEQMDGAIDRAVHMANKDVGNFSNPNVSFFLKETWLLLPESNARLVSSSMFTIREYRNALFKMERFISCLDVESIYQQYHDLPSHDEFTEMQKISSRNLEIGTRYLQIELYSIAILEAISDITGGDGPLILFVGMVPNGDQGNKTMCLDRILKSMSLKKNGKVDTNKTMIDLLTKGVGAAKNERMTSSLSKFIYLYLGENEIIRRCPEAKEMFMGRLTCEDFLRRQDKQLIEVVARACGQIAFARQHLLNSLHDLLEEH